LWDHVTFNSERDVLECVGHPMKFWWRTFLHGIPGNGLHYD
jgi:hypothetical protein